MKRLLLFFSLFLVMAAGNARAQAYDAAELLTQKEAVSAQEEFFLVLKLDLPKGGHVYWKNSGDAGEAVSLTLDLPEGFSKVAEYWPVPEKFTVGSFTEYGYRNTMYLPVKIKAAKELPAGVFEISGKAVWMVCIKECIPVARSVSALLTAGIGGEGVENPEVARVIAALPPSLKDAVFYETSESLVLSVPAEEKADSLYFFPADAKVLTYSAAQQVKTAGGRMYLFMKKASADEFVSPEKLNGTLVYFDNRGNRFAAAEMSASKTVESLPAFPAPFDAGAFLTALFLAFIGGIVLNLMPCVFPVLSLKAFRLLHAVSGESTAERKKAGVGYAAGILFTFIAVAGVLIALRAAGTELGWGFQLQYPPFVFVLALFMFFLGLVFSDVVSVGESLADIGQNLGRHWGDFGTGVLAVLVATPCAAPFMGSALGYGLMSPPAVTIAVFTAMGLGLAFPFLMLDFYPSLGRFLPKSGAWTETFRRFLAFPLYATAAWLLWVLEAQSGSFALAAGLGSIVLLALTAWLMQTAKQSVALRPFAWLTALITSAAVVYFAAVLKPLPDSEKVSAAMEWRPYDAAEIQDFRRAGVPVFVKFSAKWCLTCLVNERTAFASEKLKKAFEQKGIAAFAADWTNRSDEITAALESFGRAGVPLYVYYAPHAEAPVILPQLITDKTVLALIGDL